MTLFLRRTRVALAGALALTLVLTIAPSISAQPKSATPRITNDEFAGRRAALAAALPSDGVLLAIG
ncbi:MAG: hypothetical protein IT354_14180, partial [Gemmatimonadaceae bacterium]|nr:hypothetical protein [Gemmatimonadaceae bacterium]